jgi:hypothetical protein
MQSDIIPNTSDHKYLYANSINMTFQNMVNARENNCPGIRLYDRLHLSEVVYGNKYRKYNCDHVYKIEKNVAKYDNVYLLTFIDEVENLIRRDDGLGFTSEPTEIRDETLRFVGAHNDSSIKNKKIININDMSIPTVFEMVLNFIGE